MGRHDLRFEYCPRCDRRGEPREEGFAEYECENGHSWLIGGPL